ncbi:TIGR04104 family putative zinc finger protein [Alkalibacillus silvisoli]|uniref:CXXC-20-CXXC protein n=1 Tax=Alkalibacillus silvisoli TaxID=392823 RepID=A0ABN0ZN14_9BACI
MLTCANCNYQFQYKEALPFSWKTRVGHTCPNCDEKQYYTASSRKRSFNITIIAFILIIFLNAIDVPFTIILLVAAAVIVAMIFLSPYIYKLSSEEEPMW